MDLVINKDLTIPGEQFQFSYVRSGGPGGQNVNKVSSSLLQTVKLFLQHILPLVLRLNLNVKRLFDDTDCIFLNF